MFFSCQSMERSASDVEVEQQMERFDSYAAIENMIRHGEILLSDLERLLNAFHKEERLSSSEQEALLEIAWRVVMGNRPQTG